MSYMEYSYRSMKAIDPDEQIRLHSEALVATCNKCNRKCIRLACEAYKHHMSGIKRAKEQKRIHHD